MVLFCLVLFGLSLHFWGRAAPLTPTGFPSTKPPPSSVACEAAETETETETDAGRGGITGYSWRRVVHATRYMERRRLWYKKEGAGQRRVGPTEIGRGGRNQQQAKPIDDNDDDAKRATWCLLERGPSSKETAQSNKQTDGDPRRGTARGSGLSHRAETMDVGDASRRQQIRRQRNTTDTRGGVGYRADKKYNVQHLDGGAGSGWGRRSDPCDPNGRK